MHHEKRSSLHITGPSIVFYPQGLHHRLCVPPDALSQLLCARIKFEQGKKNALFKALPECLHIRLDQVTHLSALLDLLFSEMDSDYPGQQMVLDRLCDVVVVQLIRYAYESGHLTEGLLSGFSDAGLSRALEVMHSDPAQPWRLEQLAEISSMSRSKFAKHFHEVVGSTPADYLTERRMMLAQSLLKKNKAVKTVAIEVGYGSQPAFTKAFTAKLGMSPRSWLNSLQNLGL